jgi:hypothetical protein
MKNGFAGDGEGGVEGTGGCCLCLFTMQSCERLLAHAPTT